jgi:rSAM/selenodomain-associated transferase 1
MRVLIFARAPVPGEAKTRLIPELGREGAAQLARRMLLHTVAQAQAADLGPVELCVTPAAHTAVWAELELAADLSWSDQGAGDLGQRMGRAADRATRPGQPVLLIGTDCPQLDAEALRAAARALSNQDACIAPAADGGYALLGLNRCAQSLFTDIPWSTGRVAQITRQRIAALGWSLAELPQLHDIDEPEDLRWLPAGWLG